MNTKNALLLSFLCIASANAMSKLDQAKQELLQCRQAWNFFVNCKQQETSYNNAKKEFLAPLYSNVQKGIVTAKKDFQTHKEKSYLSRIPFIGDYLEPSISKQDLQKILIAWGSGQIIEGFDGVNHYYFLESNISAEALSHTILEDFMHNTPPNRSSHVEDMMGKSHITHATPHEINQAKQSILELLKQQTQKN